MSIESGGAHWEAPFPFAYQPLKDDDAWLNLEALYSREGGEEYPPEGTDRPLHRCLEVARESGARLAITETRYIDLDFRGEYSEFYSRAFQHFHDSTHRVHFFTSEIPEDRVWNLVDNVDLSATELSKQVGYVGYMVVRPQVRGVVGRTMLLPPPEYRQVVRTAVKERVHFFGQTLEIRAVPFIQQDARLGSCAHAAAWMCHFSSYLGDRGVPRRTIAEFSASVDPGLGVGRTLPSTGLTLHQLSDVLTSFGLPPLYYEVGTLSDADRPEEWPNRHTGSQPRVARVCCRYLNSALPVLVVLRQASTDETATGLHAVCVCGYARNEETAGGVMFIVNDDRRGPYLPVKDVLGEVDSLTDVRYSWEQILVPVPEKLWLSGEAAERKGCEHILAAAEAAVQAGVTAADRLLELHRQGHLTVRTYATTSNRFKARIRQRIADQGVIREYACVRLPRYVWIVEAVDRNLRTEGLPSVVGEVVFDATSDDLDPVVLAIRLPGIIAVPHPDDPNWDDLCSAEVINSGGQFDP